MIIGHFTTFERWHYLAAFLPVVESVISLLGWTKVQQSRLPSSSNDLGLFGALVSGEFVGLTFNSAINVGDSIMNVINVEFVSYQTLWRAFPLPDRLEEVTGGEPRGQVTPKQTIA